MGRHGRPVLLEPDGRPLLRVFNGIGIQRNAGNYRETEDLDIQFGRKQVGTCIDLLLVVPSILSMKLAYELTDAAIISNGCDYTCLEHQGCAYLI